MKKKIILLIVILQIIFTANVFANEVDGSFESYVSQLTKYTNSSDLDIDLSKMADNLKSGKGFLSDKMIGNVLNMLFVEIKSLITSIIIVLAIILISSIVKNMKISQSSTITSVTNLICYVFLAVAVVSNFYTMLDLFKTTCQNASNITMVASPFLLGMLIVNGAITSAGIIQPLILFASSFSSFLVVSVITPMLVLSAIFALIGNLNEKNTLLKVGSFLRKTSIWVLGIMLTIFLGVLSMETSISKDVDSLAVKTTTAAVSNFVPVVGKFFSDSMSAVVGASKIITKVGGILGIITIIIVSLSPIIKMIAAWISYAVISVFSETIDTDTRISRIIKEISEIYKTMTGIIIANSLVFIISIAIMLNLSSSVVS